MHIPRTVIMAAGGGPGEGLPRIFVSRVVEIPEEIHALQMNVERYRVYIDPQIPDGTPEPWDSKAFQESFAVRHVRR